MTNVPDPEAVKRPAAATDPPGMGDWVRRLCYPLVLPAIVAAVWAHAWAAKVEAPAAPLPAPGPGAREGEGKQVAGVAGIPSYGFSTEEDAYAAAGASDGE